MWKGTLFAYIVSGILYFLISALIVFLSCRSAKVKVEFWTYGRIKMWLIISLYLIYGIPFFIELYGKYAMIVEIVFGISLFIWACFLILCCDDVFILDNQYADIYVKGGEKAQFAEAGSIKRKGDWIIVNREINGCQQEVRIKESDIVRIDYYGGPIISVESQKLFKRNKN